MYKCEVCGERADIHHIVFRSQGGFDIKINYKYLCPNHHRGNDGPHHNRFVDLKYKLELQEKLYYCLPKDYYWPKELTEILGIHNGSLKRLLKDLKIHKEGYSKKDIIFKLMGSVVYSSEMIDELALDLLINDI